MERQAAVLWCPRCLGAVGEAARCPACGLRQHGAGAARLRVVVHRLYELGEAQRALAADTASLRAEQARLLASLDPRAAAGGGAAGWPAPPVAGRAAREWRPGMVHGVLLGLVAVLVALAALIFSVVAWVNLGDAGRAGLLAGATLLAVATAAAAHRRLPATAEALGGLAVALALVDWYAARRAGVAGGWPATAWWALGTGLGAGVAAAAGRWLAWQRPTAALLAQACAVLLVATVADAPWTVGAGLALAAAAAAGAAATLASRRAWRPAAATLAAGAALLDLAAVVAVLASPPIHDLATAAGPALALAATALAPALARATLPATRRHASQQRHPAPATAGPLAGQPQHVPATAAPSGDQPPHRPPAPAGVPAGRRRHQTAPSRAGRAIGPAGAGPPAGRHAAAPAPLGPLADLLVALAVGALLAAGGALLAAVWASWALLAAVAVLGTAAGGVGRALPAAVRRGTALAAGATLAVGVVGLLDPLLRALAVPPAWASDPWTAGLRDGAATPPPFLDGGGLDGVAAAILALLAVAAAAALAAAPRPGPRLLAPRLAAAAAPAAGVGVVAALPPAARWPLWAALLATATAALVAGTAAVLADRRTVAAAAAPTARGAPAPMAGGVATPCAGGAAVPPARGAAAPPARGAAAPAARGAAARAARATSAPAAGGAPAPTAGGAAAAGEAGAAAAVPAAAAGTLLVIATCWALASEGGTLGFLGTLPAAAAVGAAAARGRWLRGGLAGVGAVALVGESAAVVLHGGGDAAAAGVAAVVAAGALLVAGVWWRRGTAEGAVLEPLGLAGQVLGVLLAVPDQRRLAVALTVAVPALLLAGVRRRRPADPPSSGGGYLWAGAATTLAATWAWLWVADVRLPEAYTLPAAAVALAAGASTRRRRPRPSSWLTYGPGLAVALLPSLAAVGRRRRHRPAAAAHRRGRAGGAGRRRRAAPGPAGAGRRHAAGARPGRGRPGGGPAATVGHHRRRRAAAAVAGRHRRAAAGPPPRAPRAAQGVLTGPEQERRPRWLRGLLLASSHRHRASDGRIPPPRRPGSPATA